jgi:hypothetical protein
VKPALAPQLAQAAEPEPTLAPAKAAASPAETSAQATPASPDRAAAEQRIAEDHEWCLRAKPRFDCEQARALSALQRPAKSAKPKQRADRQAAAGAGKQMATAPGNPVSEPGKLAVAQ